MLFRLLTTLALIVMGVGPAQAKPAAGGVGFDEVRVPYGHEAPLVAGIWYPTTGTPRASKLESFTQTVAPNAPVRGRGLPLIVLSHGGGGSFAGHYDTALALARAGFVVAAVSHAGDTYDDQSKVLMLWRRPDQLSRLISYVLESWRGHRSVDPRRVGAFGFSNGGFTALVAAGGVPDLLQIDPYCAKNPDHDLCTALRSAGIKSVAGLAPASIRWQADSRVRAVALAAPAFAFTFDRAGLANVRVPVQLWRGAVDRHQPNPWYEEWLKDRLPRAPDYHVVADAGHYAFLAPCSDALMRAAPAVCTDRSGFDRAKFHEHFNADLIAFFRKSLR